MPRGRFAERLAARSGWRLLNAAYRIACALGVDPVRMIRAFPAVSRFVRTAVVHFYETLWFLCSLSD